MSPAPERCTTKPFDANDHETLLRLTVDAVIEVGKTMQDLVLDRAGPAFEFDREGRSQLECGSCISLTQAGKSFNLALFGSKESCRVLARALLGAEPDEPMEYAELADALGEILNMVAGVTKRRMSQAEGNTITLGLSLFMTGTDCFRYLAKAIRVQCQRLVGPEVNVDVIIIWKEG